MNKKNVGKPITTHDHLQRMVKDRKWIVIAISYPKISTGKKYTHYQSWVAAAFVNRQYKDVCNLLNNNSIFEYKKNK